MRRKPAVCFVDDSRAELRRFADNLEDRFTIGVGTSIPEALSDLKQKGPDRPDLFVLDLYFPERGPNTPQELAELQTAWDQFLAAKSQFASVMARLGQTSRGGFRLARQIRQDAGLKRAGIVEAYEDAGAGAVIKKPDPTPDDRNRPEPYDAAFRRNADDLARRIERSIRRARPWWRRKEFVLGFLSGIISSLLVIVLYRLTR
jgi:CheY-like chemotaxis protein